MTGVMSPWYEIRCEPNRLCVYIHNTYLQRTCQWEKHKLENVSTEMAWIVTCAGRVNWNIGAGMASQTASFQLYHRHVETPLPPTPVSPYSSSISPVPVSALLSGDSSAASSSLPCCMQETSSFLASSTAALLCPVKRKRRSSDSLMAHWPFFHYSFLFIEGWGTANVHRMWWTFNYWTYFTYLFRSHSNKRVCVSGEKEAKQAYSSVR